MGGARCLGRQDEIGSLQAGKLADVALWRIDDLGHADIADPVCAIVLGPPATLQLLLVGGSVAVEAGEMRTADSESLARHARDVGSRAWPPRRRVLSRSALLAHVADLLVRSQATPRRMSEAAISGPLGEPDLTDEAWTDPVRLAGDDIGHDIGKR